MMEKWNTLGTALENTPTKWKKYEISWEEGEKAPQWKGGNTELVGKKVKKPPNEKVEIRN